MASIKLQIKHMWIKQTESEYVPHTFSTLIDVRLQWLNTNRLSLELFSDSKVHGGNMGHIWGRQDPGGPHVGHMNFAIWVVPIKSFHPGDDYILVISLYIIYIYMCVWVCVIACGCVSVYVSIPRSLPLLGTWHFIDTWLYFTCLDKDDTIYQPRRNTLFLAGIWRIHQTIRFIYFSANTGWHV